MRKEKKSGGDPKQRPITEMPLEARLQLVRALFGVDVKVFVEVTKGGVQLHAVERKRTEQDGECECEECDVTAPPSPKSSGVSPKEAKEYRPEYLG